MRQQHHQTRLTDPLRLTGRNELINNTLCRVAEVTELRFPDDK